MIQVKHLVAYLSSLDPEMEVSLDKNGWEEEHWADPEDAIRNCGLFHRSGPYKSIPHSVARLIINN